MVSVNPVLKLLLEEHSKSQAEFIASEVIKGGLNFNQLLSCFYSKDNRVCQRAGWPLSFIAETNSELFIPIIGDMINNLQRPVHNAVIRNSVRIWQFIDIPTESAGQVYEYCFNNVTDIKKPPAIRVFSMTVCTNICQRYPELSKEMLEVIQEYLPHEGPAFRSRAHKEIKRLKKWINA